MSTFDKELDARGLKCPLPILRCKKAIAEIAAGQVLKIVATDKGAVRDFQGFCKQTGHELVLLEEQDEEFIFHIKKKAA